MAEKERKKPRKPWTEEELKSTKFGRITVLKVFPLSESRNPHRKDVLCKCDCGKEFVARLSNVASGNTTSCGCYEKQLKSKREFKSVVGNRYGRLVVISEFDDPNDSQSNARRAICACDCGSVTVKRVDDLRAGMTRSCGCLRKEVSKKRETEDLTGQTFNELTAIRQVENHIGSTGFNRVQWLWRCSCGKEIVAMPMNVKRGMTKSCGHIGNSYAEVKIHEFLKEHDIDFLRNVYPYEDMVSPDTGRKLSMDFQLKDKYGNVFFIEHQGSQHYRPTNWKEFGKRQREVTDEIKKRYCLEHGIKLYETRYDEDYIAHVQEILIENGLLERSTL